MTDRGRKSLAWLAAILVAVSGASAGLYIYAVLRVWSWENLSVAWLAVALETGVAASIILWLIYSKIIAALLKKDIKIILLADSISYLPAIILLSYLYFSQFPTLISRYHLMRTMPPLVIGMVVAIKIITYIAFRFSSLKFIALVGLSFVAAMVRAGFSGKMILPAVYSLGFLFWWQAFFITALILWNGLKSARNKNWGLVTFYACALIVLGCVSIGYIRHKPAPPPSFETIILSMPEAQPFALFVNQGRHVYRRVRIADQVRDALILPPPNSVETELTVPPSAKLDIGMGILPEAWDKPGDGVNFVVEIKSGDSTNQALSVYLDPKGYARDRVWEDRSIDLSAYAGQTIKIVIRAEGGPPLKEPFERKPDTRFDYSVISEPRIFTAQTVRPNVILILVDTLRGDHIGAYGYGRDTTPNIDALAGEGVVFQNTVSQSPWTLPSVSTVFTSLYPTEHGLRSISRPFLDPQFETVAEIFSKSGYETAAFSATPVISEQVGFGQGFQTFDESCYPMLEISSAQCLTDAAIRWSKNASGPYFLYMHYYDVHSPYNAPAPYKTMFDPDYVTDNRYLRLGEGHYFDQVIRYMGETNLTERELQYLIALYDGEIRYADENIGRLLKVLRASNDNTIIAVIADHGEEFLDHGHLLHGHSLYSEMLNVPFILRLPGALNIGKKILQIVRLIDVAPTLIEAAGIKVPDKMHGQSALPLLNGDGPSRIAFSEVYDFRDIYSLRDGNAVIIRGMDENNTSSSILFDLNSDPAEKHDVADREPDLVRKMVGMLDTFIKSLVAAKLSPKPIDNLTRERLKALGYLSDNAGKK